MPRHTESPKRSFSVYYVPRDAPHDPHAKTVQATSSDEARSILESLVTDAVVLVVRPASDRTVKLPYPDARFIRGAFQPTVLSEPAVFTAAAE